MLHITSYHYYLLAKIHLYQSNFNMSCHWRMNMYCVLKLHVDMSTMFKKLLTKEKMSMQIVRMEKGLSHLWKITMKSFWYCAWYSISSLFYLIYTFINHKLYKWLIIIHEFGDDPMKIWFKHQNKNDGWWQNWRYWNCVELCFQHVNCHFWWSIFYQEFPMFGHAHIFLCFIVVCIHLGCYTTSDVHLIISALYENKLLKEFVNQKRKNVPLSLMFFFFFWLKIILICVLIIWLSSLITLLLYSTSHMISTHLYLYKCVLSDIGISFKKEGKNLHICQIT